MTGSSPSNNEGVPGLRLRGPFRLASEGYVKFLRPAFVLQSGTSRRQANNITDGRYGHRYPYRETKPIIF